MNRILNRINLDYTINSGQVFLWEKYDDNWYGINGQNVIEVDEGLTEIKKLNNDYFFRKDDNFKKILANISRDKVVSDAVKRFTGLRLLRQDPFQCYISFIVSSNSNIPKIKNSLYNICKKFGKKVQVNKKEFYVFPEPKKLALAENNALLDCGLGYRAKAVKMASKVVVEGQIDFESLKKVGYLEAKTTLLKVFGIGNKVADCIMLFSLEKLDAFPLDTWMMKILKKYYSKQFQMNIKSLTEKQYNVLHEEIVKYFGPFAGYSQQFLFKMERDLNQKKWL